MDPWWTEQQAGLIGGIAGSVFGIFGGIFGTVAGICAPKGKCKALVLGMAGAIITMGIISLIAGMAALLLGQGYFVYYPLILLGVLSTSLFAMLPLIHQRYREADNRRLEAEELRRSSSLYHELPPRN